MTVTGYVTIQQLKPYLGITGTGDDELLDRLIFAAQRYIETDRGYSFMVISDTTRYFTVGVDTDGPTLNFDMWCAAITTVTNNADGASPETITSTYYTTRPRNIGPYHAITIKSSSNYSWTYTSDREAGISVAAKWGWSTTPPNDIKQACTRLAAYYYRQKDAGVFDTTAIPDAGVIQVPQGIPRDVRLILDQYPRGFE